MKHTMSLWVAIAGMVAVLIFLGTGGWKTAGAQSVPPTSPTGLTATLTSPYQVSLSWSVPVNVSSVIGYYIYRNGAQIASTAGTSYVDTLTARVGYYTYAVAGYGNGGGAFSESPAVSLSVVPDTTPPSAPTALAVTAITSSSIALSWNAASDNVGVVGYYLIKDGINVPMSTALTGTTYTDSYLNANATHTYKVIAYDAAGNESAPSNMVTATTFPSFFTVSPPFGLMATAISTNEIDLAWGGSTAPSGTIAYNIYRNSINIASTSNTSYDDIGLPAGAGYTYYVTAFDGLGDFSEPSNNVATSTFLAPASTSSAPIIITPVATTSSHYTPSLEPTIILGPQGPMTSSAPAPSSSLSASSFSAVSPMPLYFGMHGMAVTILQDILIAQGNLGANYATGYFGALTQQAVQKLQCAEKIVCSGSPWTTGWGYVGPKTRGVLIAL